MSLAVVTTARAHNERTDGRRLEHRRAVGRAAESAGQIVQAAQLIAHQAEEVLARGGRLEVAPQMAFLVGALMRLVKDVAVIEHLQKLHTEQRRPVAVR